MYSETLRRRLDNITGTTTTVTPEMEEAGAAAFGRTEQADQDAPVLSGTTGFSPAPDSDQPTSQPPAPTGAQTQSDADQPLPGFNGIGGSSQGSTNVADVVAEITDRDSVLMQRARTEGRQIGNRRGVLNSSITAGASMNAVLDRAIPMAQQTAAQRFEAEEAGKQRRFQSGMSRQQFEQASSLSDQEFQQQFGLTRFEAAQRLEFQEREQAFTSEMTDREFEQQFGMSRLEHTQQKELQEREFGQQRQLSEQEYLQASNLSAQDFQQQFGMSREQYRQNLELQKREQIFSQKMSVQEFSQALKLSDKDFREQIGLSKQEYLQGLEVQRRDQAQEVRTLRQQFEQASSLSEQEFEQQLGMSREAFQQNLVMQENDLTNALTMAETENVYRMQEAAQQFGFATELSAQDAKARLDEINLEYKREGLLSTQQYWEQRGLTDREFQLQNGLSRQEYQQDLALQERRLGSDYELALLDAESRSTLLDQERAMRESIANIEGSVEDRQNAMAMITSMQELYQEGFRSILSNTEMAAEDRNALLRRQGELTQIQMEMVEALTGFDLQFPAFDPVTATTTTGGTTTGGTTTTPTPTKGI